MQPIQIAQNDIAAQNIACAPRAKVEIVQSLGVKLLRLRQNLHGLNETRKASVERAHDDSGLVAQMFF